MEKTFNKLKENIKKHDKIFMLILIFLSCFGITLNILIVDGDELWNFQSIYKMYNGFQIYKDFNVIITPLFFIIGKILFNILGANFLTFRIYNIIVTTILYFTTYLLLKKLEISKKASIIITLIMMTLSKYTIIRSQANYTTMALMLCVTGIIYCIKKHKHNAFIQGVIVFLILCTKQNIGVYYGTSLILFEILRKNETKQKIKNLTKEFIIFSILLTIFLLTLYLDNILYDFVNYTILGMEEFANQNISISPENMILIIFFIIINLVFTILFIKNKKANISEEEKEKLITLNCFAIPLNIICWPIVNGFHALVGMYISIILFIYIITMIAKRINFKLDRKLMSGMLTILSVAMCGFSVYNFCIWNTNINNLEKYNIDKKSPYYGGVIEKEKIQNINVVENYIKNNENNVIILSYKAALYMVPIQRNNGMMDLPFKGNLGKDGEKGLIEKIKNMENTEILIVKDEKDIMWQESKLVREYIKENMQNIGEIEEFEIWRKK
ncbi:MAG: hypothetical protein HFJ48_06170 [Clostridia bacterium]|nr:hypothetical protein [Clostridia bacterium]